MNLTGVAIFGCTTSNVAGDEPLHAAHVHKPQLVGQFTPLRTRSPAALAAFAPPAHPPRIDLSTTARAADSDQPAHFPQGMTIPAKTLSKE